ncbi:MAG TPA: glycosyltransferase family 39 protein, partial [Myxococcota bacterium]|nr:glycosyltransferase family 39 protein [Myxococcota bacterium]
MTASEGGSGVSRTEGWALAALVAAAAGLRWIVWTRTVVLFDDGPRFLAIARAMDAGWWSAALLDAFHPFYPLLVVAVRRGLGLPDSAGGWESAGALVSVAGGAAAVGFLFLLLRDAFGRGPAWCGAILLAVHGRATDYSSDVQSDGLYLGLFAAGLWLGWRAWRRRAVAPAAGAGLAAGLAYLTRPEGLGLLPVFAGLAGLEIARRRWPLAAGARWLAALGAGALVCIAPYIVALHEVSGEWALTRKKSLGAMVRAEPAETPGAPAGTGGAQKATTGPGAADPAPPLPPWTVSLGSTTPAGIDPRSLSAGHREQDGLRVALAPSAGSRAWEAFRMLVRHSRSALGYGALGLLIAGLV